MAIARFLVARSKDDQYYVNLIAANAEILLTTETYKTRINALNAIASIQDNAPNDARYERLASGAQFYFVLRAGNGQILGTSERYTTRAARDSGVEAVKRAVAVAEITG